MEKIEARKSIEKAKALMIFAIIFLLLTVPILIHKFSDKKESSFVVLTLIFSVVFVLYLRIRRLNHKLSLLTK